MKTGFIHLHNHSDYSILDGAVRVTDMVARAKSLGMEAMALTDHGNMYGVLEFYTECLKEGIKPLLGCELYLCEDSEIRQKQDLHHLVVIAKNREGWQNLIRLVSWSNIEGKYFKPRVDKGVLEKYSGGLVGMSACLQGEVAKLLVAGLEDEAAKAALGYAETFGGDFFLEVMNHGIPEEETVMAGIRGVAEKTGLTLVATNDCHYMGKEDREVQDMLLCIQTGSKLDDPDRFKFQGDGYHICTEEEMRRRMPGWEDAIENTAKVASVCELELETGKPRLPAYQAKDGASEDEALKQRVVEGLKARGISEPEKVDRAKYEYGEIERMGLSGYFLIVGDIVKEAKEKGIRVGPGRGSAAGSMVCYALGITEIDPVDSELFFERFLNVGRANSLPDIDMDFQDTRRDEVINSIKERWGEKQVGQIVTFGRIGARMALRDVARIMGMSYPEQDRLAKMVKGPPQVKLEEALAQGDELAKACEGEEETREVVRRARRLEGIIRNCSVHAAGVVISDRPLYETAALEKSEIHGGGYVIQADMETVEKLGMLKFDCLGLRNLSVIQNCLDAVERETGKRPDVETYADEASYKTIAEGNTTGIFQLESDGMRKLISQVEVRNFSELVACIALYRPGPLESGMAEAYVKRKKGEMPVEYFHPDIEGTLKETYGVMVYQEQIMAVASKLAGYSMVDADKLRKAMGKKKAEILARERDRFVAGCGEKGIEAEKAGGLFNQIEKFAGYAFNKSHSTAYAQIAYQTAYLKTHYPKKYMASLLESVKGNMDKQGVYINHTREMGITVMNPDVKQGGSGYTCEPGGIRVGMTAVKGVGTVAERILKEREKEEFSTLGDFLSRAGVQSNALEALAKSGALDCFGPRGTLVEQAGELAEWGRNKERDRERGQMGLFGNEEPDLREVDATKTQLLEWEMETTGAFIESHPIEQVIDDVEEQIDLRLNRIDMFKDGDYVTVAGTVGGRKYKKKNGTNVLWGTVEDGKGYLPMVSFNETAEAIKETSTGEVVLMRGRLERDFDNANMVVSESWRCEDAKKKRLIVKVPEGSCVADTARVAREFAHQNGGDLEVFIKDKEGGRYPLRGVRIKASDKESLMAEIEKGCQAHAK